MKIRKFTVLTAVFGMLCGCSAAPVTGDRDPLSYYPDLPQENRYHVYDEEGLQTFVENGSGIALIGDVSDEDSAYAVYVLHDMLETYDLSAGYYEVINEEGPSHNKTFTSIVKIDGIVMGKGIAGSKKASEQEAARDALSKRSEIK